MNCSHQFTLGGGSTCSKCACEIVYFDKIPGLAHIAFPLTPLKKAFQKVFDETKVLTEAMKQLGIVAEQI